MNTAALRNAFTLVCLDRKGLAADLTGQLGAAGINILDLKAQTISGMALVTLQVDQPEPAMRLLSAQGLQVVTSDLITLQVADQPGALAQITRRLFDAGLNIRGISTLQRINGFCCVALSTDDDARARDLLGDVLLV